MRNSVTPEQVKTMTQLYTSGMGCNEIGEKMGLPGATIWYRLSTTGVPMRPKRRRKEASNFHRGGSFTQSNAIYQVHEALKKGTLKRPDKCQWCRCPNKLTKSGRSYIHAHHYDYNKPLDVIFLCKKCHHEWHDKFRPIPKRAEQLQLREGLE